MAKPRPTRGARDAGVPLKSVTGAIECAAEIQRRMARRTQDVSAARTIQFRMGINLGDVVVEGSDRYGDGVKRDELLWARLSDDPAPRLPGRISLQAPQPVAKLGPNDEHAVILVP